MFRGESIAHCVSADRLRKGRKGGHEVAREKENEGSNQTELHFLPEEGGGVLVIKTYSATL